MTSLHGAALDGFLESLNATVIPGRTVVLRNASTNLPIEQSVPVLRPARVPSSTSGPFTDRLGRNIFVDVFDALTIPPAKIQREGSSEPFLLLSNPPATFGSSSTLHLDAGIVWISASELATVTEPRPSFIGLEISSATISIVASQTFDAGTRTLTLRPTATSLMINARLRLQQAPSNTTNFQSSSPEDVTFQFRRIIPSSLGGRLTAASSGSLSAFGVPVNFQFQPAPTSYNSRFNTLDFPFTTDVSNFLVHSTPPSLAEFSGEAAITSGAWTVPIAFFLGPVTGSGGMSLNLAPGLEVLGPGRSSPFNCRDSLLYAEGGRLIVSGLKALSADSGQLLQLWKGCSAKIRSLGDIAFNFVQSANDRQFWSYTGSINASLDQPRTVNNEPSVLSGPATISFFQDGASTKIEVRGQAASTSLLSYALKNLLLKVKGPNVLEILGKYSDGQVQSGTVNISYDLRYAVPFLPDPYATNINFDPSTANDDRTIGPFQILAQWQPNTAPVFDISLPASTLGKTNPISGRPEDSSRSDILDGEGEFPNPIRDRLKQNGPLLLDLSTNASQFGVSLNTSLPAVANVNPSVSDLFFQMPYQSINITALPTLQWEPVTDPKRSVYLSFADCGPTTVLAADSVTLTPVAPRPALDAFMAAYTATQPPSQISIRFGLPFGMVAYAQWVRNQDVPSLPPVVSHVQPKFALQGLYGGDQLSITASLQNTPGATASPAIPGLAQQRVTGAAPSVDESVMGNLAFVHLFNTSFAGTSPKIPVTRIDISGFGASLFSDWENPNPTVSGATVSKVKLEGAVGRTIKEVIQVSSRCFFYGFRVVKTFTTERLNNGQIIRVEGNWQATSDGNYDFNPEFPDIITHPGVVPGVRNVSNIRDIRGGLLTPPSSSTDPPKLQAVLFDCTMDLEGVLDGIPALNQLGYILISGIFGAKEYETMLQSTGMLCRPIDAVINIASTALEMAVRSVGVAATRSSGGTDLQFAVAAFGTVHFPKVGQWSFVSQRGNGRGLEGATPINVDLGVPLIRASPPSSPYCFADPYTLLSPEQVSADYSIVFSTGTQRVQFPRPKIEAGSSGITSTLKPLIADVFALGTSSGPFPPPDNCIPFPSADFSLNIGLGGSLSLHMQYDITSSRTLQNSNTSSTIITLGDHHRGHVTLSIDTLDPHPWVLNITDITFSSSTSEHGIIMGVTGDILSDSSQPMPRLEGNNLAFGTKPSAAAGFIGFLQALGPLPQMATGFTNEWKAMAVLNANKKSIEDVAKNIPALKSLLPLFKYLTIKVKYEESLTTGTISCFVEGELDLPVGGPTGLIVAVIAGGGFDKPKSGPLVWKAEFGLGFGYKQTIPPSSFGLTAVLAVIGKAEVVSGEFLAGGAVRFSAELDFGVASGSAMYEGGIQYHRQPCTKGPTDVIWRITQNTVAVEVHIFWILDIAFEYHDERHDKDNNGLCDWVDP
ncbi:MAG: hypothetical protein M1839_005609 [Geoglossum umbratile]|nr:MAG: hypothetical protein M1839_005609 [Geoglossum umbratile]